MKKPSMALTHHLAKENLQLVVVLVTTHLDRCNFWKSTFCSYLSGATIVFKLFVFN